MLRCSINWVGPRRRLWRPYSRSPLEFRWARTRSGIGPSCAQREPLRQRLPRCRGN